MRFVATVPAVILAMTASSQAQDLRAEYLGLLRQHRSIDGTGNNVAAPTAGAATFPFARWMTHAYADGSGAPSGGNRPGARAISNVICAQATSLPNAAGVSDYVWQWGQFLDHDIVETPVITPLEPFDIPVPTGDPFFDPRATGTAVISLNRSLFEMHNGVREQVNEITAFIDASNVYGSNEARAVALRTLDGTGQLKTSPGRLLPFNEAGLPNAPSSDPSFFLAGDVRANEQVALTAMHTLFVREHNHWARRIAGMFRPRAGGSSPATGEPEVRNERRRKSRTRKSQPRRLTGDEIYELARAMVAAEMQVITYREFLPVLLGADAIARYRGYRPDADPSIGNAFAAASYRFGHTMLSPTLQRVGLGGVSIPEGPIALAQAFFRPDEIINTGIEPYLRGLATQRAQEIDTMLIDDVRNFLFGPPGSGGFDLAALNIQRGRDHGLPGYNQARREMGLGARASLLEVSTDPIVQTRLQAAYGNVEDVDLWVGGLAEDPAPGALVGETVRAMLARQFEQLRDGDRFWYGRYLPEGLRRLVRRQTLARIIRRNTTIGDELPDDLWRVR